jgi:hypothetical protein
MSNRPAPETEFSAAIDREQQRLAPGRGMYFPRFRRASKIAGAVQPATTAATARDEHEHRRAPASTFRHCAA